MITNAKDRTIDKQQGSLPQMTNAMKDWFQDMTLYRITKTTKNFKVVETAVEYSVRAVVVIQPTNLKMTPDGQRDWASNQLYAEIGAPIMLDDVVKYQGMSLRVISRSDYSSYGFMQYALSEDYIGAGPGVTP